MLNNDIIYKNKKKKKNRTIGLSTINRFLYIIFGFEGNYLVKEIEISLIILFTHFTLKNINKKKYRKSKKQ